MIDFVARRESILGVLALHAPTAQLAGYVQRHRLRLLDRIEYEMAATLQREGMPAEDAAQIALHFVANTVANHAARAA